MCFTEGEPASLWSDKICLARKAHKCDGCSATIDPKSLYRYIFGIVEGDKFSYNICGICSLDQFKIHEREIEEGCDEYESWCPIEDLADYIKEKNLTQSSYLEGQKYLEKRKVKSKSKNVT